MKEVVILADPVGKGYDFAKGIDSYLRMKRQRDFPVYLTPFSATYFKDGEFKVKLGENVREKECFLVYDSNQHPERWLAFLVPTLSAIRYSAPSGVTIVFPYHRFSRQDRKDESRVNVTSADIASMIEPYIDRGMTVDLHSPQIQSFYRKPFDNLYSFPTLMTHLKQNHPDLLEDIVIVSPDAGGAKRAETLIKRLTQHGIEATLVVGYKTRKRANEVEKVEITGDVRGKNCLVVDDIIDTGDTIIKTGQTLRERGAKKLFVYGTHGLFTEGTKKFSIFDRVMTSDTLQHETAKNLEIVSLIDLFGEAIYRNIMGQSLSALFNEAKETQG